MINVKYYFYIVFIYKEKKRIKQKNLPFKFCKIYHLSKYSNVE